MVAMRIAAAEKREKAAQEAADAASARRRCPSCPTRRAPPATAHGDGLPAQPERPRPLRRPPRAGRALPGDAPVDAASGMAVDAEPAPAGPPRHRAVPGARRHRPRRRRADPRRAADLHRGRRVVRAPASPASAWPAASPTTPALQRRPPRPCDLGDAAARRLRRQGRDRPGQRPRPLRARARPRPVAGGGGGARRCRAPARSPCRSCPGTARAPSRRAAGAARRAGCSTARPWTAAPTMPGLVLERRRHDRRAARSAAGRTSPRASRCRRPG